jgi:hypothetical protein
MDLAPEWLKAALVRWASDAAQPGTPADGGRDAGPS